MERASDASPAARRPSWSIPGLFARGLLMGAADVVPGVSGGTLALILGIYTAFIDALGSLNLRWMRPLVLAALRRGAERRAQLRLAWLHLATIHWRFLLALGAGMGSAIAIGSHTIPQLLEHRRAETLAFFFGLILASVPLPARMVPRWGTLEFLGAGLGCALAAWVTGLPALQLTHAPWFIFLSGAIAICAMVLPGISGSFMLLVLGQYSYVVGSIPARRLDVLAVFALGAASGLLGFARLLRYLLHRHPGPTLAVLTGFMVGALRAVWPLQRVVAELPGGKRLYGAVWPAAFDATVGRVLVCAATGFALVCLLERFAHRRRGAHS